MGNRCKRKSSSGTHAFESLYRYKKNNFKIKEQLHLCLPLIGVQNTRQIKHSRKIGKTNDINLMLDVLEC